MSNVIKTVAKHSVIYGAGDLLSKSISFLMIPLYTHYLSPAHYGVLELLDLTSYIIGLLLAMGISQSVVRYYYDFQNEDDRQKVISVALVTIWGVSLVVLPLLMFSSKGIAELIFGAPDNYHLLNITLVSVVVNLSNEIPMTLIRIQQKSVLYVTVSTSRLIVNLTLNIVFIVHFQLGVLGILLGSLTASLLAGVFLLGYTLRRIKLTYSRSLAKAMLVYSLPLVGSWVGMYILNFADRFFLQRLGSLSDVGIYSLAYKFGMMPNALVLGPFLQIWAPKRFEIVREPDAKETYSLVFTYFWFLQLLLFLGIGVLIKDVLTIISEREYHTAYQYVPVILMSYMCFGAYSYSQFGILLKKKTKYLAMNTLAAAAVNTIANLILIPRLGIWGAAIATLVSFAFLFLSAQFIAQRLYFIPYQIGRLIKMTVLASVLYGLASLVNPGNIILSIFAKLLIVVSFPFVLYVTKFYTADELHKLTDLRRTVSQRLVGSVRLGVSRITSHFRERET